MNLRILPEAALDIAEQAFYYEDQADLTLSKRWESSVEAAIGSLRTFPELGPRLDGGTALRELRKLHIQGFPKHLIFYRFESATSTILIVHVLHGAQDLDSLLS